MANRGRTLAEWIPDDRWPFPDPDAPGVFRVPLDGRGKRFARVDAESLPLILGRRWIWTPGARGTRGHAYRSDTRLGSVKLARVVAGVTDGKVLVGHANDDTLDCRRANLTTADRAGACRRARKRISTGGRPSTSRYKGVTWDRQTGKWRAAISAGGVTHSLGRYVDELDAAREYDEAAREHFGDAARLNLPGEA